MNTVKIALFVENLFEDLEFWYPLIRMKEEEFDVVVVAPECGRYKGKAGLEAVADMEIGNVTPNDFDALIIPGGYAPDHMRRHQKMIDFTADMNSKGKLVSAICHGPWLLASANVVRERLVTSFFAIKDDMVNAGANWIDQAVVKDENIITSRTPDDLPMFCRCIINELKRDSGA